MSLNRSNVIHHFKGLQFQKEILIFDQETLQDLEQNYRNSIELSANMLRLNKSYGIFAITDSLCNKYNITSFHYVDFSWFSARISAKIMHKAHIEEWRGNNGFSINFPESPYQNSGDVCGVMKGDYRDCFEAIKEKEQLHQLLHEKMVELPYEKKQIKIQSGLGLDALTEIERVSDTSFFTQSISHIF